MKSMHLNFIGWQCGKPIPSLGFHEYSQDKSFCDLTTIDAYIKCTANWREETKTQLLLSYIKPHVKVLSSTVSQWIKQTLKLSGIDFTTLKGHSTRTSSSSNVESTGLLVLDILNSIFQVSEVNMAEIL